jgi:hypothetical protein
VTGTGSVATTTAADPVDFEEMASKQHRCPETQRLLGGTSLKLAFRQKGTQRLAGDISTGTFRPIWRLFSTLWPPMVLPLTLKNAFSQQLLLKFLDTQFQR